MLKLIFLCIIIWIFSLGYGSLWSWNVLILGSSGNSSNESRADSFEDMGMVNNVWTVANNIILLSVLCSTMALYAPIVKAIWKAKKVSQDRHSRAASFRLFNSQHEAATRSGSVCKSKSDSNIRPSLNGRDKNGWKRPLMKNRLQTSKTSGYLGVGGIQAHRAASFRLFSSAQNPVLEKPLLPNGNLSHIQEQDERKSSIRDQVNSSKPSPGTNFKPTVALKQKFTLHWSSVNCKT